MWRVHFLVKDECLSRAPRRGCPSRQMEKTGLKVRTKTARDAASRSRETGGRDLGGDGLGRHGATRMVKPLSMRLRRVNYATDFCHATVVNVTRR